MQREVAIELIKLISSNFSKNLKKIIIINSTIYLSCIYHLMNPFLIEEIKSIIEMNYVIKNAIDII